MTLTSELATELYAILTEEYLLSGELLALIAQEKQQLECNDQAALIVSTQGKHKLLDRLQAVTAQRLDLAGIDGLDLPQHWHDSLAGFPALASQHARLLDVVQRLRTENQTLGQMLNRKALFVTRMLDNLNTENIPADIYQRNGSRQHDANTRKLITV